jgi:GDPmannose 4,6-dehydratase
MKKALITGITGQDGSYLADLLVSKGYEVHGIQRRSSTRITKNIDHLLAAGAIETHYGDLTDANSIVKLLKKIEPDEIYNIGSMSHVRVSFDIPEYTGQATGIAPLRILEALHSLGMTNTKFYQASSSEMFGDSPAPQNEETPFHPQSPYGCAKLYGYWITKAYRKGYNMFACNGILFNHESPRRGETFVVRKIIKAAVRIKLGLQKRVILGNLNARRDWGFAGDYVKAIYMIMQHEVPDDFCIATEDNYTVLEFAEMAFRKLGIEFREYAEFDEQYLRPNEVPDLLGDATKARTVLGWKPDTSFEQLIDMMIESELAEESKHV